MKLEDSLYETFEISKETSKANTFVLKLSYFQRLMYSITSVFALIMVGGWFILYFIVLAGGLFITDAVFISQLLSIIFLIFAVLNVNCLLIPLWEFMQFPYLKYYNPFQSLFYLAFIFFDFIPSVKNLTPEQMGGIIAAPAPGINIAFFILTVFWIILFIYYLLGNDTFPVFSAIHFYLMFFIPIIHYILLLIFYILICFKQVFIMIKNTILLRGQPEKDEDGEQPVAVANNENIKESANQNQDNEAQKTWMYEGYSLTGITEYYTLFSFVSMDFSKVPKCCKCHYGSIVFYIKCVMGVIMLAFLIAICAKGSKTHPGGEVVLLLLLFIITFVLNLFQTFPFYLIDSFRILCKKEEPKEHSKKELQRIKQENYLSKASSVVHLTGIFIAIYFVFMYFKNDEYFEGEDPIQEWDDSYSTEKYAQTQKKIQDMGYKVRYPLCEGTLHGIKILNLMEISTNVYFYKNDYHFLEYLKPYYFPDDVSFDYRILTEDPTSKDHAFMTQIDYNKNGERIASILTVRGSVSSLDWMMDIQLWFPAFLINISSKSTVFFLRGKIDGHAYIMIESLMAWPIKSMYSYTMIDPYIKELEDAYERGKKTGPGYADTLIFTGHSLGGGLCKVMGRRFQKTCLAISGPGINTFRGKHRFDKNRENENFMATLVDILPDNDAVPRIEESGGTKYRVFCDSDPKKCHGDKRTLCMAMIMCDENYRIFCKNVGFTDEEIRHFEDEADVYQDKPNK